MYFCPFCLTVKVCDCHTFNKKRLLTYLLTYRYFYKHPYFTPPLRAALTEFHHNALFKNVKDEKNSSYVLGFFLAQITSITDRQYYKSKCTTLNGLLEKLKTIHHFDKPTTYQAINCINIDNKEKSELL